MLFLTAVIWGLSFIAQDVGMEKIEGFTFSAIRQIMGGVCLVIYIIIRDAVQGKKFKEDKKERAKKDKKVLVFGCILGVVFFAATNLQQFAFNTSTPGKIAFITAFYMFFVAIISIFIKKKANPLVLFGIFLGIIGLYFLCIGPEGFGGLTKGDFLSLGCAVFFAVQILLIDKFAPEVDGIKLSAVQFLFSGIVSAVLMMIFEHPDINNILAVSFALIFSGVFSCGIAYTLQIVGQKYTEPTIASLIMCLESVFAAISEALILRSPMSPRETLGCVIMFSAILISQLAEPIEKKIKKSKLKRQTDEGQK